MWIDDIRKMEKFIQEVGSPYAATVYIAQKARKLKESCYHIISDSEAVEWAISDIPPENIDARIKNRIKEETGEPTEDHVDKVLSTIAEDNIRIAVLNSYKLSVERKQLVFDYNGIKDRSIRCRIRILARMAYLPS